MCIFLYNYFLCNLCRKDLEDIVELDQDFENFDVEHNRNQFCWDYQDYIFLLTKRKSLLTLMKNRQKIIGFCLSVIVGFESELYKIIIQKEYRNKGLGKILLLFHLGSLKIMGVGFSFLEVSHINFPAICLYKKIGYKVEYVRKKYYINSDALVMKREL